MVDLFIVEQNTNNSTVGRVGSSREESAARLRDSGARRRVVPEAPRGTMLAVAAQAQKGLLTEKMRYRDNATIERLMPAGADAMSERAPRRRDFGDQAGYAQAIRKCAEVFKSAQRIKETSLEHDYYMLRLSEWSEREGHGRLVEKKEIRRQTRLP